MTEYNSFEGYALKRAYRKGYRKGLEFAVKFLIRMAFRIGDNKEILRAPELFYIARLLQEEAIR